METLTDPVETPDITTLLLVDLTLTDTTAVCRVQAGTDDGAYTELRHTVADGKGNAQGVRAVAVPSSATDVLEVFTDPDLTTGFTDVVTAFAGGTKPIKERLAAVETKLIQLGLWPAGTVAP